MRIHRGLALVLALVMTVFLAGSVSAQYPTRQITVVIQAAPGGVSDITARTVASLVEKELGVPVIAVNRPGAAGALAMSYLSRQAPDGYTFGYVPVELSMVRTLGYGDVGPDNLDLLAQAVSVPAAVTVRADSPWTTLQDLIDYAKANPGKIRVGNAGPGSIWHIAAGALERATGVRFTHVPFDGASPAVASLLGGHIEMVTVSPTEILPALQAGEVRVLAVMDRERSPVIPDVPTLAEVGVPGVVVSGWGGFAAPKGIPADVRAKLADAIAKAIQSPEFAEMAASRGMTVAYKPGEEFAAFAQEQYEMFAELIPALGIVQ
ncbi:Bug family tripartite tricarboxylate transporter substrate binding protein [Limnochorda sp.]|uniref:Bug family tripartite tricarboxylate transporter substrate binding protein n=1 Tax=Limnochorda sp. TaxID=1940279 RepID=UPI0039701979